MEAEKHPASIAAMFNAIAARYDRLNHLLSAGLDARWRARAIQALGLTGREDVLDLCTGTADLALASVERKEGAARVIGVDFAQEMLRHGQRKLRERHAARVRLVRGDAACIPIRDHTVDAVTIGFGIRNVQQPLPAFRELHRVLRPGGRLAILEFAIPRAPIVRQCYLWYFRRVLPRIGRSISGHSTAYSYLPASVETFGSPEELSALLREAGFDDVRALALTWGIVYLHVATKPLRVV